MGIRVSPRPNESIGLMIKRLRKLCEREGIIRDMRRHEVYEKPSEKRRRMKNRAISRAQHEQKNNSSA